jgi:hypothetical protein
MRRAAFSLVLILCVANLQAQQAIPASQTARQALIEMFFSKTPGTFAKHLPELTRTTLDKAGTLSNMQQFSTMLSQIPTEGSTLETYDSGPVLVATKNLKTQEEFEVRVENETFRDGQDDIDLSFHVIKQGKEDPPSVRSLLTFSMKQEAQVWRLNEISLTLHIPLADPQLLKTITEKMKPQQGAHITFTGQSGSPMQPEAHAPFGAPDSQIISAMKTILTAETRYFATYPNIGYTCTLSDLDGFGAGEPNEHQAMLINSSLASGKRYGYIFTLAECKGGPATSFRLTAVPNANNIGRKAFCADQSALIRSSSDGNPAMCAASGVPMQ